MTTATNNPVTAPLAMIFANNDGLISKAIAGLTEEELWHRASDQTNPIFWMLGHVVHTRGALLRIVGEDYRTGWGDIFQRGASLRERTAYPAFAEIERVRADIGRRIPERLALLTDDQLAQPSNGRFPGAKTFADQIAFLALHDSYHVGQMAFVRKLLGHAGIAG